MTGLELFICWLVLEAATGTRVGVELETFKLKRMWYYQTSMPGWSPWQTGDR